MATAHTTTLTQHATLSTTTIDSVVITGAIDRVTITNRAAAAGAALYVTLSHVSGSLPADPVTDADGTYCILAQQRRTFYAKRGFSCKILGSGNAYSVEGELNGLAS